MSGVLNDILMVVMAELAPPSAGELVRMSIRLFVAVLLGALLGYDRESKDSAAGLRTHMLVALGAAVFVIAGLQSGMDTADLSRILQGLLAGIGFLGAGAIIKLNEKEQIKGLTTAASIWATAAIGATAAMGHEFTAAVGTLLALLILAAIPRFERRISRNKIVTPPPP
jgi:putative Mg2+ transporter-C (MgtC) family protein